MDIFIGTHGMNKLMGWEYSWKLFLYWQPKSTGQHISREWRRFFFLVEFKVFLYFFGLYLPNYYRLDPVRIRMVPELLPWSGSGINSFGTTTLVISLNWIVVDPTALNLDLDTECWPNLDLNTECRPNLDPDPGSYY